MDVQEWSEEQKESELQVEDITKTEVEDDPNVKTERDGENADGTECVEEEENITETCEAEEEGIKEQAIVEDGDAVFMGKCSAAEAVTGLPAPTEEDIRKAEEENKKDIKQRAEDKLKKELAEKIDSFGKIVLNHLIERVRDDAGLADDILQPHKTWKKCHDYIYENARKQASGNCAAVQDDLVYEWAEDYYHKDDKELEEKKAADAKKAEHGKKKVIQRNAVSKASAVKAPTAEKPKTEVKKESESVQKSEPRKEAHKSSKGEMEGQMDLFSFMNM